MNLRKIAIIILALLPFAASPAKGKENSDTITIAKAFADLPSSVVDLIPRAERVKMLYLYSEKDSVLKVENNLQGTSYIEKATKDFVSVSITPVSNLQIKILPKKGGGNIVMTIYSIGTNNEISDSELAFYDSDMKLLKNDKIFPTPKLEWFFETKGYKTNMKEIRSILPFETVAYKADGAGNNVKARLTYNDVISIEDAKLIEMFLKPEITFIWDGSRFKLSNSTK